MNFTTVIGFICAHSFRIKSEFFYLIFDTFGMRSTVVFITRSNKNISDHPIFGIAGLMIKIVKTIRLSWTIQNTAFGICYALGDLF